MKSIEYNNKGRSKTVFAVTVGLIILKKNQSVSVGASAALKEEHTILTDYFITLIPFKSLQYIDVIGELRVGSFVIISNIKLS